MRVCGTVKVAK